MRLTALVEKRDHVCCRYRLAAFASCFQNGGHELAFERLPTNTFARLSLFRRLDGANVILQRKLLTFWERSFLRRHAAILIFDFDDAVYLRDSYAGKPSHHPSRHRRFVAQSRTCDAVVAGNRFLAEEAALWAGPERVYIIPTCVQPANYPVAEHRAGVTRLVWIGSASTLQGLRRFAPVLEEIGRRVPELSLHLICDQFLELTHLPVVTRPWSEPTEAASLAECDIGVGWVPDDDWSRGKCGLKVLQYMAAGLPVVANPVGVQAQMVNHGETGFLAETPEQWIEAVGRLAASPELRRRMGAAGRRRVEAGYSVGAGGQLWTAMLADLERRSARAG